MIFGETQKQVPVLTGNLLCRQVCSNVLVLSISASTDIAEEAALAHDADPQTER